MASIVPDFAYDIFISYRQNDNKYDQWVTEFVHNLRLELEATVKDRLSIYFDENPQDGILETHQVDRSLSGKLNALIFIPIISNTYCDTASFAWQHEFIPFKNRTEQKSNLDLYVTLPNGNVASRILPVKIHEIDDEDSLLLERELAGVMRSIDFIYRSQGVNRSLRPKDDNLQDNQNGTIYRNQINKTANAIKELIQGIKKTLLMVTPGAPSFSSQLKDIATKSVSASVPESIRYTVVKGNAPTIFLAWTAFDLKSKREEMLIVLQKAGFNVLPAIDCPSDEEVFREKTREALSKANCSLHMLGAEYGRRFEAEDEISFPRFQFEEARKLSEDSSQDFHTFLWLTPEGQEIKPAQQTFINYIRNSITRNMSFSNSPGAMQLIDDIRAVAWKKEAPQVEAKDTDIFFIFNQQDEQDAGAITDLISHVYPIETMNILPDGEDEYRELSKQQIPRSKLAVVYFKYAADWALPFIKQIWKQVGGASSPTPILLVGEDDPKTNAARVFKAPKVTSTIVPKENVPDEVKKVYTSIIEP